MSQSTPIPDETLQSRFNLNGGVGEDAISAPEPSQVNYKNPTQETVYENIVTHVGKDNGIESAVLADRLPIQDRSGQPKTRKLITDLVVNRGVPIAASQNGYFIPENGDEVVEYYKSLSGRINKTRERREAFIMNALKNNDG